MRAQSSAVSSGDSSHVGVGQLGGGRLGVVVLRCGLVGQAVGAQPVREARHPVDPAALVSGLSGLARTLRHPIGRRRSAPRRATVTWSFLRSLLVIENEVTDGKFSSVETGSPESAPGSGATSTVSLSAISGFGWRRWVATPAGFGSMTKSGRGPRVLLLFGLERGLDSAGGLGPRSGLDDEIGQWAELRLGYRFGNDDRGRRVGLLDTT